MSRTKCWLNGPVVMTPGTTKYHLSGDASMKRPFAAAATPSANATPIQKFLADLGTPSRWVSRSRHGGDKHRKDAARGASAGGRGSSCRLRPAEPFVQTDAAEARFTQRHERVLRDQTAEISCLGIGHHFTQISNRLQVAGHDLAQGSPFRTRDLDDGVLWRLKRDVGHDGRNVLCRDGLKQGRRARTFAIVPSSAMLPRNSMNWVERMMV